jgi:hypothetical protein
MPSGFRVPYKSRQQADGQQPWHTEPEEGDGARGVDHEPSLRSRPPANSQHEERGQPRYRAGQQGPSHSHNQRQAPSPPRRSDPALTINLDQQFDGPVRDLWPFNHLNDVQSAVFNTVYKTDKNCVIAAPVRRGQLAVTLGPCMPACLSGRRWSRNIRLL